MPTRRRDWKTELGFNLYACRGRAHCSNVNDAVSVGTVGCIQKCCCAECCYVYLFDTLYALPLPLLCCCCTLLNLRVKKRADIAISCVGVVVVVVAVDVSDFVVVDVVRAVWPPLPNKKMCIVFIAFVYILHANV